MKDEILKKVESRQRNILTDEDLLKHGYVKNGTRDGVQRWTYREIENESKEPVIDYAARRGALISDIDGIKKYEVIHKKVELYSPSITVTTTHKDPVTKRFTTYTFSEIETQILLDLISEGYSFDEIQSITGYGKVILERVLHQLKKLDTTPRNIGDITDRNQKLKTGEVLECVIF